MKIRSCIVASKTRHSVFVLLGLLGLLAGSPVWAVPAATIEVLPRFPTTRDELVVVVNGSDAVCWPAVFVWESVRLEGQRIVLAARTAPGPLPASCNFPGPYRVVLVPFPTGLWSVEFRFEDELRGAEAFEVRDPAFDLGLQAGRFAVQAQWRERATGVEHDAAAVQLTDQSGYFWFFGPGNVELTVKILDGRGLNGAFWLFIASLTDVAYTVRVTDRFLLCGQPACGEKAYEGTAGRNQNFIDVEAFPR